MYKPHISDAMARVGPPLPADPRFLAQQKAAKAYTKALSKYWVDLPHDYTLTGGVLSPEQRSSMMKKFYRRKKKSMGADAYYAYLQTKMDKLRKAKLARHGSGCGCGVCGGRISKRKLKKKLFKRKLRKLRGMGDGEGLIAARGDGEGLLYARGDGEGGKIRRKYKKYKKLYTGRGDGEGGRVSKKYMKYRALYKGRGDGEGLLYTRGDGNGEGDGFLFRRRKPKKRSIVTLSEPMRVYESLPKDVRYKYAMTPTGVKELTQAELEQLAKDEARIRANPNLEAEGGRLRYKYKKYKTLYRSSGKGDGDGEGEGGRIYKKYKKYKKLYKGRGEGDGGFMLRTVDKYGNITAHKSIPLGKYLRSKAGEGEGEGLSKRSKGAKKAAKTKEKKKMAMMTPEEQKAYKAKKRARRARKLNAVVPVGGMVSARGLYDARPTGGEGGAIGLASIAATAAPLILQGIKALAQHIKKRRDAKAALKGKGEGITQGAWARRFQRGEKKGIHPSNFWAKVYRIASKEIPLWFEDQKIASQLAKEFVEKHAAATLLNWTSMINKREAAGDATKFTIADFIAPVVAKVAEETGAHPAEASGFLECMRYPITGSGIFEDVLGLISKPEVQAKIKEIAPKILGPLAKKAISFIKGKLGKSKRGKKLLGIAEAGVKAYKGVAPTSAAPVAVQEDLPRPPPEIPPVPTSSMAPATASGLMDELSPLHRGRDEYSASSVYGLAQKT